MSEESNAEVLQALTARLGKEGLESLFEALDALSELRQAKRRGAVVAVVALKGGVGKSSLVAWLGSALARMGRQVAAVDLDVYSPDLATLWGFTPQERPAHDLSDWVTLARAEQVLEPAGVREWTVPVPPGLQLLPAPDELEAAVQVDDQVIRYVLDAMARAHEIVLVDLGPSPSETIMPTVLGLADRILWVSTPDLTAVRHLLRASQIMAAAGVPPARAAAVLNAVPRRGQLVPVEEIRRENPFPLWAEIPADPSVPGREGATPPLGPKPVQDAVEGLARRLLRELKLDEGEGRPEERPKARPAWWLFRRT